MPAAASDTLATDTGLQVPQNDCLPMDSLPVMGCSEQLEFKWLAASHIPGEGEQGGSQEEQSCATCSGTLQGGSSILVFLRPPRLPPQMSPVTTCYAGIASPVVSGGLSLHQTHLLMWLTHQTPARGIQDSIAPLNPSFPSCLSLCHSHSNEDP